jgi:serine protease AprX
LKLTFRVPGNVSPLLVAIVLVLLALASPAAARAYAQADGRVTTESRAFVPEDLLAAAKADGKRVFRVIVTGTRGTDSSTLEREQLRETDGRPTGSVTRTFEVINALSVELTGDRLLRLAGRRGIASITPDAPVKPSSFNPVELWPSVSGVDRLWGSTDSSGTFTLGPQAPAIAIVDSGVQPGRVEDFGARVVANLNLTTGMYGSPAVDTNGHGTLVAGLAAGAASAYPGAAPNANIVSLDVVREDGSALTSDVIAAADWIYANRDAYGIRVANFSLHSARPDYSFQDPLDRAVRRLWLTGTVVVAAAGNEGPHRMVYAPASDPFVITVGAVGTNDTPDTADDTNAPWSSYGYTGEGFAKPELAAPGRHVAGPFAAGSTIFQSFPDRVVAPGYGWMSGTSFAAPIVAGAAAQILARHPEWTPDQVKAALMMTARSLPASDSMSAGVGEIDAAAAAAVTNPPNANEPLYRFVSPDPVTGEPSFDAAAFDAVASTDATWVSATWVSATWVSATWVSATWVSNAYTDATWVSATWVSSSPTDATWVSTNGIE